MKIFQTIYGKLTRTKLVPKIEYTLRGRTLADILKKNWGSQPQ